MNTHWEKEGGWFTYSLALAALQSNTIFPLSKIVEKLENQVYKQEERLTDLMKEVLRINLVRFYRVF